MTVAVVLWSETLLDGSRQLTARGEFVMVSVGPDGRPVAYARASLRKQELLSRAAAGLSTADCRVSH